MSATKFIVVLALVLVCLVGAVMGGENHTEPAKASGVMRFNVSSVSFAPPGMTSALNASQLGCDATNQVCTVIDFAWLQCATQKDLMDESEAEKCPSNASFTWPHSSGSDWLITIPIKPTCFNASTHVCANNYQLCPIEAPTLCGVQCYSASQYTCYQGFHLCPSTAPNKCGESCYSPNQYKCRKGSLVSVNETSGEGSKQYREFFYRTLN